MFNFQLRLFKHDKCVSYSIKIVGTQTMCLISPLRLFKYDIYECHIPLRWSEHEKCV